MNAVELKTVIEKALKDCRKKYGTKNDAAVRWKPLDIGGYVGFSFCYGVELVYVDGIEVSWITLRRGIATPLVVSLDKEPALERTLGAMLDEVSALVARHREEARAGAERIKMFRPMQTTNGAADGNLLERVVWDALKNSPCPPEHRFSNKWQGSDLPCRWCRAAQAAIGILKHMVEQGEKPEHMISQLEVLAGWNDKADTEQLERDAE